MLPGLYAGGGVALAHRPFLLVGGTLPPFVRSPVRPRLEMRWTFVRDFDSQAQLSLGASMRLGTPHPGPQRPRR